MSYGAHLRFDSVKRIQSSHELPLLENRRRSDLDLDDHDDEETPATARQ